MQEAAASLGLPPSSEEFVLACGCGVSRMSSLPQVCRSERSRGT